MLKRVCQHDRAHKVTVVVVDVDDDVCVVGRAVAIVYNMHFRHFTPSHHRSDSVSCVCMWVCVCVCVLCLGTNTLICIFIAEIVLRQRERRVLKDYSLDVAAYLHVGAFKNARSGECVCVIFRGVRVPVCVILITQRHRMFVAHVFGFFMSDINNKYIQLEAER